MKIERTYLPECTLGTLTLDDGRTFATIERARRGDHPCIPEGEYVLRPHESPHHGPVYAFVGPGVWEWAVPAGETGRCLIELHVANRASELLGCCAPGMAHGEMDGQPAVLHSAIALARISEVLGRTEVHNITIRGA